MKKHLSKDNLNLSETIIWTLANLCAENINLRDNIIKEGLLE